MPFVVAGPMINGSAREVDLPTNHADLIPTLMGFAGIDPDAAREPNSPVTTPMPARLSVATSPGTHPARRGASLSAPAVHDRRRDQRGQPATGASPVTKLAKKLRIYSTVVQPNHVETVIAEVDVQGERHLVKLSRYFDNEQFWTVPGHHDERLHRPQDHRP